MKGEILKKSVLLLLFIITLISCDRGWENISEGTDPEGGMFILALDRSERTTAVYPQAILEIIR